MEISKIDVWRSSSRRLSEIPGLLGKLKLATVVIGAVDVGLMNSFDINSRDRPEMFFLSAVITALILSVLNLLRTTTTFRIVKFLESSKEEHIDMSYHGVMGAVIAIGAILMPIHVNVIDPIKFNLNNINPDIIDKHLFEQDTVDYVYRLCAVSIGFLNSFLYGLVSFVVYMQSESQKEVEVFTVEQYNGRQPSGILVCFQEGCQVAK